MRTHTFIRARAHGYMLYFLRFLIAEGFRRQEYKKIAVAYKNYKQPQ